MEYMDYGCMDYIWIIWIMNTIYWIIWIYRFYRSQELHGPLIMGISLKDHRDMCGTIFPTKKTRFYGCTAYMHNILMSKDPSHSSYGSHSITCVTVILCETTYPTYHVFMKLQLLKLYVRIYVRQYARIYLRQIPEYMSDRM